MWAWEAFIEGGEATKLTSHVEVEFAGMATRKVTLPRKEQALCGVSMRACSVTWACRGWPHPLSRCLLWFCLQSASSQGMAESGSLGDVYSAVLTRS